MARLVLLTVLSFAPLSMMHGVIAAAASDDQCQEEGCHVSPPTTHMVSLMQKQKSLSTMVEDATVGSDSSNVTAGLVPVKIALFTPPLHTYTHGRTTYGYFKGDSCGSDENGSYKAFSGSHGCGLGARRLGLSDTRADTVRHADSDKYPRGCIYLRQRRMEHYRRLKFLGSSRGNKIYDVGQKQDDIYVICYQRARSVTQTTSSSRPTKPRPDKEKPSEKPSEEPSKKPSKTCTGTCSHGAKDSCTVKDFNGGEGENNNPIKGCDGNWCCASGQGFCRNVVCEVAY